MTKKTLVQIRTNSRFSVNYKDLSLSPKVELILLFVEPEYQLTKKGEVLKGSKLSEFRIQTSSEGIANMIGQLQALQGQLQTFTNMSEALNTVISLSTKPVTP